MVSRGPTPPDTRTGRGDSVGSCLYVTRKFPPSVGGMETLASEIWAALSEQIPKARLISLGRRNAHLLWWLPDAVARTAAALRRDRPEVVVAGDPLVFAAIRPLLRFSKTRGMVVVHGLDLTWTLPGYRAVVHRAVRRADRVIAISEATAEIARASGVPAERIAVVRPGISAPRVDPGDRVKARAAIAERVGDTEGSTYLLTLGRLVPRNGVRWFVAEVLPRLPANVIYIVAGEGPDSEAVASAAEAADVVDRVRLLGRVDDDQRKKLMRGADLFVEPNIVVPDDVEGFGLVIIEAALRGTPVLAADVDGITDAMVDGETGLLCASGDADAWIKALGENLDPKRLAELGTRFAVAAQSRYGRGRMARDLMRVLVQVGRYDSA